MKGPQPTIGLIHNYDLIDEVIASMNITFQDYCHNFEGSFMFGYIKALQLAGVRPVLFCITAQVRQPTRFVHGPTGATICALPYAPAYSFYLSLKRNSLKAYGGETGQAFKDIEDGNQLRRSSLAGVKDFSKSIGTYLATPLSLLGQALQQEQCQALLCQEYEYARFDACVWLGQRLNLPIYACFQGLDRTQSIVEAVIRRRSLEKCAGLIIASGREIQRVQTTYRFPAGKIHQIFNPLAFPLPEPQEKAATRAELGLKATAKVVVWHGRVEIAQKGLDILLQAWRIICNARPQADVQLLIIGTGSDAPKFQRQITALKLTQVIWLKQFISDRHLLSRYLGAADLYTLPSRQEGFPLAPIEAMACGLPVILADAVGSRDILPRERADGGIIVPREQPQALATAIATLLDDPSLRQKLGRRAQARAQDSFSLTAIGQQMREVLLGKQADLIVPNLPSL
ncbi:MAG: glycosyltransferase family 4 protein [Cyanobacteria bacterium J06623_7]